MPYFGGVFFPDVEPKPAAQPTRKRTLAEHMATERARPPEDMPVAGPPTPPKPKSWADFMQEDREAGAAPRYSLPTAGTTAGMTAERLPPRKIAGSFRGAPASLLEQRALQAQTELAQQASQAHEAALTRAQERAARQAAAAQRRADLEAEYQATADYWDKIQPPPTPTEVEFPNLLNSQVARSVGNWLTGPPQPGADFNGPLPPGPFQAPTAYSRPGSNAVVTPSSADFKGWAQELAEAKKGGAVGVVMAAFQRPYEVLTEPLVAGGYAAYTPPAYAAKIKELQDQRDALAKQQDAKYPVTSLSYLIPEYMTQRANSSEAQNIQRIDTEIRGLMRQNYERFGEENPRTDWLGLNKAYNQVEKYGAPTPEAYAQKRRDDVAYFRETASLPTQLIAAAFYDPLNVAEAVTGPIIKGIRIASVRRADAVFEVADAAARGVKRAPTPAEVEKLVAAGYSPGLSSRIKEALPFMRATPRMKMSQTVDAATDFMTRFRDHFILDPKTGAYDEAAYQKFYLMWLKRPDDPALVEELGPLMKSWDSYRAHLLQRRIIGKASDAKTDAALGQLRRAEAALADAEAKAAAGKTAATRQVEQAESLVETRKIKVEAAQAKVTAAEASVAAKKKPPTVLDSARRQMRQAEIALQDAERNLAFKRTRATPEVDMLAPLRAAVKKARVAYDDVSGDLDMGKIKKIIADAGDDKFKAIAEIAKHYEAAALSIFGKEVKDKTTGALTYTLPTKNPYRRVQDSVTHVMSLAFMGNAPGYAFRNAANNLITAMADGVSPFTSARAMETFFVRWGTLPASTLKGLGAGAETWKTSETALEAIGDAKKAMRVPDVFRGVKWSPKAGPTLQIGQNFERLASQRIMYHHMESFWRDLWPQTVERVTKNLRAAPTLASLSDAQLRYYARRLNSAVNSAEVRQIVNDMAAATGDIAHTVPPELIDELSVAGAGAIAAAEDALRYSPEGRTAYAAIVDVATADVDEAATAVDKLRGLAEHPPTLPPPPLPTALRDETLDFIEASKQPLRDYIEQLREVERTFTLAHQERTRQVWDKVRGLSVVEADEIWENYSRTSLRALENMQRTLDTIDDAIGPRIGFSGEAIARAKAQRAYVYQQRNLYIAKRTETWAKSRAAKLAGKPEQANAIWDEWWQWSNAHYADLGAKESAFIERRSADVLDAIVRSARRGKLPDDIDPLSGMSKAAPDDLTPPTAAVPELVPPAPAALTPQTRASFRSALIEKFGLPEPQADAVVAVTDARAGVWARQTGKRADEWYTAHIADVLRGGTPGDDALLQPQLTPQIANRIRGTQVVNEFGQPQVVYHGTPTLGFDKFDPARSQRAAYGKGIYFTDTPEVAGGFQRGDRTSLGYAGETGGTIPAFLNVRSLLDADRITEVSMERLLSGLRKLGYVTPENASDVEQVFKFMAWQQRSVPYALSSVAEYLPLPAASDAVTDATLRTDWFTDVYKAAGYDGLRATAQDDVVHNIYLVFDGENVVNAFTGKLMQSTVTGAKGAVSFVDDGRAVILALEGADVSTAIHETAHIFRRDLADVAQTGHAGVQRDLRLLEDWAGVSGGAWERAAEEKFARAFEQYLMDGAAPTRELQSAFDRFKDWLTNIYRALTGKLENVTPEVKQTFDRLLADSPVAKTPSAPVRPPAAPLPAAAVPKPPTPRTGGAAAVVPPAVTKPIFGADVQLGVQRAQTIADHWRTKMGSYTDTPEGLMPGGRSGNAVGGTYKEINERRAAQRVKRMEYLIAQAETRGLSAAELADIEKTWKNLPADVRGPARATPPRVVKPPQAAVPAPVKPTGTRLSGVVGKNVTAYGPDPNVVYQFRYRVMPLDDVIPSQTDSLAVNPVYDADLQPRIRNRAASRVQIDNLAMNLQPDGLLGDFRTLDRGVMIVGPDSMVESGNGRVMALRKVRQELPENWQAYQARLREVAEEYGISAEQLDGIQDPILVRERLTPFATLDERKEFVRIANEQATLAMSPVEQAISDAGLIQDRLLATLQIGDSQSVDQALLSGANKPIVQAFMESVSSNERAALVEAGGTLSRTGLARLKAALFAKTYPGAAGQRLAATFLESLDPGIKNIEAGMFASLPKMAQAESLVRSGERAAELAIGADLAQTIDVLARLKAQGIKVGDYLAQLDMFEAELNPFQKELLAQLDAINRSPKKVREFLTAYADAIESAPNPGQMGLLDDIEAPTREDILGRIREPESTTDQYSFLTEERGGQADTAAFGAERQGLEEPAPAAPPPATSDTVTPPTRADALLSETGSGAAARDTVKAEKVKRLLRDALANNGMRGRRVPGELYGADNAGVRQAVIELITGTKPPQSKAGVSELERVVYEFAGVDRKTMSGVEAENAIVAWLKQEPPASGGLTDFTKPPPPGSDTLRAFAKGTPEAFVVIDAVSAAYKKAAPAFKKLLAQASESVEPLTPEQQRALMAWTRKYVLPEMVRDKSAVSKLATKMRDFAIGDYSHRRNYHEALAYVFPYAYWYSFTYPNWAVRLAQDPAFISNYARVMQAVNQANLEYYREITGDPHATLPESYKNAFRIPFAGTDFYLNLMQTLNPLYGIVGANFERSELGENNIFQKINQYGPTTHPTYGWLYSAMLAAGIGVEKNMDAAAQVTGYVFPQERILKGGLAAAREYIPGADKLIPAGGWTPSMLLPWNKQGDYWTVNRFPKELVRLYQEGKFSTEALQAAGYMQNNEAWSAAKQAEAMRKLLPDIASFMLGQGFKPRDITDIELAKMSTEKKRIKAMSDDPTITKAQRDAAWAAWRKKYPYADLYSMAFSRDPKERLHAFTWLVLNRLPPGGPERADALKQAGLPENLITKWYDNTTDYGFKKWTDLEVREWQLAIDKLAEGVLVPDAKTQAVYDTAKAQKLTVDEAAAKAAGLTLDAWKALNNAYFELPEDSAERRAFLKLHPELQDGWDASTEAKTKAGAEYQQVYQPDKKTEAETAGTRKVTVGAALQKAVDDNKLYQKEAGQRFGTDILDLNSAYGGMTDAEKRAYKTQFPDEYARLVNFWNWRRDEWEPAHPEWQAEYRKTTSTTTGTKGTGTGAATKSTSDTTYAEKRAAAAQKFGPDILTLADKYSAMSTSQRKAWREANPADYKRLQPYWDYVYGPRTTNTGTYSGSSYTRSSGYSGGGGYSRGGGYSGGGGVTPTPPAPPPAPIAPTAPADWQTWDMQQFGEFWRGALASNPGLAAQVQAQYGAAWTALQAWLRMTPQQRLAWQAANAGLWASMQALMGFIVGARNTSSLTSTELAMQSTPLPPPAPPSSVPVNAPWQPPMPPGYNM